MSSKKTSTDPQPEAPPAEQAGTSALFQRATAVLESDRVLRADYARTYAQSRRAREQYGELRSSMMADREFRLAALNLMEDAAEAKQREEREIVQRRRAEEEMQASAERYRLLFEQMTEGFAIVEAVSDPSGRLVDVSFVECNPAFARQTGLDHLAGRRLLEFLPNLEPDVLRQFDRVLHTGDPIESELYAGDIGRWLRVSVTRIGGDCSRLALVVSDITHRKSIDQALRASEERLRLIVENARDYAIFSMGLDRRILSWNAGAQAILGYTEQEVLGESADLIFTPEDRAAGVPEREAETAMAQDRAGDERWHVRKDGSRFWGSGAMMAMHDDAGGAIGLLKIFRDQTADLLAKQALEESRLRLQQALEAADAARREAETATRAKDQFLAVLSHELRTPLTPVMLATEMLAARGDLPQAAKDALSMISRNIALEARFVDDLLDVTRIARGTMELLRAPMDVHEAIREAVEISRADAKAKEQTIRVELDATKHEVFGDFARLQQVIWNLVKNGSKFTPKGGKITVATRNERDCIVIDVADTGIGLDAAALPRIFDAFTQADTTVAREFGGLGLGLAIAKATVIGHGGEIFARSPGRWLGSTFTVTLPLHSPVSA